jgi:hypothetical protein
VDDGRVLAGILPKEAFRQEGLGLSAHALHPPMLDRLLDERIRHVVTLGRTKKSWNGIIVHAWEVKFFYQPAGWLTVLPAVYVPSSFNLPAWCTLESMSTINERSTGRSRSGLTRQSSSFGCVVAMTMESLQGKKGTNSAAAAAVSKADFHTYPDNTAR